MFMYTPRVSVVVPTANRPTMLARALASVRAQTFTDWELLVIDDGDRETAADIAAAQNDTRIRYVRHDPPRQGGGAARNTGIQHAVGEMIAFLDDDDYWLPEKLERQVALLADTPDNLGFVYSSVRVHYRDRDEETQVHEEGRHLHELALTQFNGFMTSTLVIKKAVFGVAGMFDTALPSHQEAELMLRVTQHYNGCGVDVPLVVMDVSGHEHVGGNIDKRIRGRELLIAKHRALYTAYPDKLAKISFTLALWYREKGDWVHAAQTFAQCWSLIRNPRYFIHMLYAQCMVIFTK